MPTECERLIAETLRLDGEATKGPWKAIKGVHYVHGTDCRVAQCGDYKDKELEEFNGKRWQSDAVVIASYRTTAPRLARMLRVAIECLVSEEDNPHIGNAKALAEIEKIAKEETDGTQR